MVNRDSDVMVNTFSIPIGIGVHDRGHVFTIVESGLCVCRLIRAGLNLASGIPLPKAAGIQSSGSRLPAAPSIRKIGQKLAEGEGTPPWPS